MSDSDDVSDPSPPPPFFLCSLTVFPEDESSGLHGFLNVIVHSASGLKQSLSESFTFNLVQTTQRQNECDVTTELSYTASFLLSFK